MSTEFTTACALPPAKAASSCKHCNGSGHSEGMTRTITVRITPTLHERLKAYCYPRQLSINSVATDAIEAALERAEKSEDSKEHP
jgi:predicted HicB family RNase H-like nuclease